MKLCPPSGRRPSTFSASKRVRGSVLIIVLWIAFGLVSLALYFGHSMSFELKAADNRVAGLEAEQAITGAICYVSNILMNSESQYPGALPDYLTFQREAVRVGDATFWLIGRNDQPQPGLPDQPFFDLVDESSKLNLNTATTNMLWWLPRMLPELAAAMVDWRDADSDLTLGGAEDDTYERLLPPYHCKNAPFETVDELRLVFGMDLDVLYGEDANLNGALDPNENDGDQSFPLDNRDGQLDPGLLEYLTVFSKEPTTRTNGAPRVKISATNRQEIVTLFQEKGFATDRANAILQTLGFSAGGGQGGGRGNGNGGGGAPSGPTLNSLLEFYARSGMSPSEFALVETDLIASTNTAGLVNVNTASEMVLSCIPGIGIENAPALVSYRQNNRAALVASPSMAWVTSVLATSNIVQAGPYLTGHSYQFTADIAAVGHYGRGYRRAKVVFDTSEGGARVIYRQDLTSLGWASGKDVRNSLAQLAQNRP